jgi:hypothetical protein
VAVVGTISTLSLVAACDDVTFDRVGAEKTLRAAPLTLVIEIDPF